MPETSWKLSELLGQAGLNIIGSVPETKIKQVTDDSRVVNPGALFVAVTGTALDGHLFIKQAVDAGAAAVLVERHPDADPGVPVVQVSSTRNALGPLTHLFYGKPSEKIQMVGVTGTKGKTTVTWLIQHLLESAGMPCGLMGTVMHRLGASTQASGNTTPGAVKLQEGLAQMVKNNLKACAMEVSSHALDQGRAYGIDFKCAIFTNIAPEHLDYHRTFEEYLQAKLRLFKELSPSSVAVINQDDKAWQQVKAATQAKVLTYSLKGRADLTARRLEATLEGTSCELVTPQGKFEVKLPLIGLHNVENLLAAAGALVALDVPLAQALPGLIEFAGVPGRLEKIDCGQPFPVFVDYAHTDGSLQRVLEQLREVSKRKILTVFGCGGDRDKSKRPRMGKVAAQLSDRVIITSDNPRSEDPSRIAHEILDGTVGTATPCQMILDRREAIQTALESADEGWLVLIAGKGHESSQIFADRAVPFDDRAAAKEILSAFV